MELTTDDRAALQGAMNVLAEILQQASPEVPERIEQWPEDEPTAFGACVEAGGVWFVRLDVRTFKDPDFQPWQTESLIQCTWGDICEQGPVTIINADPFATPSQDTAFKALTNQEDA